MASGWRLEPAPSRGVRWAIRWARVKTEAFDRLSVAFAQRCKKRMNCSRWPWVMWATVYLVKERGLRGVNTERLVHGVLLNGETRQTIKKRQGSGKWWSRTAFSAIQEITGARDGTRGELSRVNIYSQRYRTTESPQGRKLKPSFITTILF